MPDIAGRGKGKYGGASCGSGVELLDRLCCDECNLVREAHRLLTNHRRALGQALRASMDGENLLPNAAEIMDEMAGEAK